MKTFKTLLLTLAIVVASISAQAANEPLEAQIDVVRTDDGRVLLTSKIPTDECLAQAQADINLLLPHATSLAGAPIDVTPPADVYAGQLGLPDSLAVWNGGKPSHGSIEIFNDFCKQPPADQRATIAHELGHAVDHLVFTGRPFEDDYSKTWADRRGEIAATAWAVAIYQRAGLPVDELESHFSRWPNAYWIAVQAYLASHSN